MLSAPRWAGYCFKSLACFVLLRMARFLPTSLTGADWKTDSVFVVVEVIPHTRRPDDLEERKNIGKLIQV